MLQTVTRAFFVAAALSMLALPAAAQETRYDVKTINFDLWCQEQAHLAPERCDKRLPEDEEQYEAYRAKVEKYEIPFLQGKEREQRFDSEFLHNDPVDQPRDKQPAQPSPATKNNP